MPRAKKTASVDTPRTKTSDSTGRKRPAASATSMPSIPFGAHDVIAQRAYELFMLHGEEHGHDIDHWLRAEQELRRGGSARSS